MHFGLARTSIITILSELSAIIVLLTLWGTAEMGDGAGQIANDTSLSGRALGF